MRAQAPGAAWWPGLDECLAGCQEGIGQGHCVEYRLTLDGEQFGPRGVDAEPAVGSCGEGLQGFGPVLRGREQYARDVGPGAAAGVSAPTCGRDDAHGR